MVKRRAQRVAGAVLVVTLAGGPLDAAEPRVPASVGSSASADATGGRGRERTLSGAAESYAAAADPALALQPPAAPSEAERGRPFFKTPRGVVTGVLMVAGLSWVFYSKSHDRVRSPAND